MGNIIDFKSADGYFGKHLRRSTVIYIVAAMTFILIVFVPLIALRIMEVL